MYEEQPAIIDWLFSYKKQDYKKPRKSNRRSVGRTNKKNRTRGRNRKVSIKNSTFSDKDFKDIQVKLKEIRTELRLKRCCSMELQMLLLK
mgnify:CR=1 FL=1